MTLAMLNMFIQFAMLFLVLVSLRLRLMGKIKAHGYLLIAGLLVWVAAFVSVIFVYPTDPMFTTHPTVTMASPLLTAVFGSHLFLALLSFSAATVLAVMWFQKREFMARSRIPAVVTEVSWLLAFALGLYLFLALNV